MRCKTGFVEDIALLVAVQGKERVSWAAELRQEVAECEDLKLDPTNSHPAR